jgi:hypothetical protein
MNFTRKIGVSTLGTLFAVQNARHPYRVSGSCEATQGLCAAPDHPALVKDAIRGVADTSSLPTSKDDAGVDAPEAESIRNCMLYRHAPGLAGDEIDAFRGRVAIFEIEGGRCDLVA